MQRIIAAYLVLTWLCVHSTALAQDPEAATPKRIQDPLELMKAKRVARIQANAVAQPAGIVGNVAVLGNQTRFITSRRVLLREIEYDSIATPSTPAPPPAPPEPDDDLTEIEEPKPAIAIKQVRAGRVVLARSNVDDWIFGNLKSDHDRRTWLNGLLDRELSLLAKSHNYTPDQIAKLRLAGQGDIKHFFERVAASRREFEAIRKNEDKGVNHLINLTPLEEAFEKGPFGEGSLISKIRGKM